jgi:ABC-type Mn2+/Zn2+ transport system permease subunit
VLVVAMLVTPAATAQLLATRFSRLMVTAIIVGTTSAVAGLYLSFWLDVASGATIVLIQTGMFLVALLLGPRTGLLARRRSGATRSSPVTADDRMPSPSDPPRSSA